MSKIAQHAGIQAVLCISFAVLLVIAGSNTAHFFGEKAQKISAAEFDPENPEGDFGWLDDFDEIDNFYDEFYEDNFYEFDEDEFGERECKKAERNRIRSDGTERNNPRRQGNAGRTPRNQRVQNLDHHSTEWNNLAEWLEFYLFLNDPASHFERILKGETPALDPNLSLEEMIDALIAEIIIAEGIINQDVSDSVHEENADNVARVENIEYSTDGINFFPVPDVLYVMVGTEVTFRAVSNRRDVPLPADRLSWSGAVKDWDDFTLARRVAHAPSRSIATPALVSVSAGTSSATARVIDVSVSLYAPGVVALSNGTRHVPIMLNDVPVPSNPYLVYAPVPGWKCADYCPPGASCDHRPLEPVFGLNYIGPLSGADPNLMPFTFSISPSGTPGTVKINVVGNDAESDPTIRTWAYNNGYAGKGKAHLLEGNPSDPDASLFWTSNTLFYVEGIRTGTASVSAIFMPAVPVAGKLSDSLPISVVSLVETQGGLRKVINAKGVPVNFLVEGLHSDLNTHVTWTESNSGYSLPPAPQIPVKLSSIPLPSGVSSVNITYNDAYVPENIHNRRHTSTVTAKVGNVQMSRTVRVALNGYPGEALAVGTPARRTQVQGLTLDRETDFDNTVPNNPNPGSNSLIDPDPDFPNLRQFSQAWYETKLALLICNRFPI